MEGKSCFFIGHAVTPQRVKRMLEFTIERYVAEKSVVDFYFGYHGEFDWMALSVLRQTKEKYPWICLNLVIPYHPAEHPMQRPDGVDALFYPFEGFVMPRYAIARANREMIKRCDYLIAYVNGSGRARSFLEYAERLEKRGGICTENLAKKEICEEQKRLSG